MMNSMKFQKGLTGLEIAIIIVIIVAVTVAVIKSQGEDDKPTTLADCDTTLAACQDHCLDDPFSTCNADCNGNHNRCSVLVTSSNINQADLLEESGFNETLNKKGEHSACLNKVRICLGPCAIEHIRPGEEETGVNRQPPIEIRPHRPITWNDECVANCNKLHNICEAEHGHGFLYRVLPKKKYVFSAPVN